MPEHPLAPLNLAGGIHQLIGKLIIGGFLGRNMQGIHRLHKTGIHQWLNKPRDRFGTLVKNKLNALAGGAK